MLTATSGVTGIFAVLGAVGGVIITSLVGQFNRRGDNKKEVSEQNIAGRVADTEAALEAWNKINEFQGKQIQNLTVEVADLRKRVDGYEDKVIPEMQKVISEQQGVIDRQQSVIDHQQRHISELLERLENHAKGPETQ